MYTKNSSADDVRRSNRGITTLVELLRIRANEETSGQDYAFLTDGELPGAILTYEQLDKRARAIAASLQEFIVTGERALLLYPPGLEFIAGFFGSLYSGLVAVPAYPPEPGRSERTLPRLQSIAADAQASLILTTSSILPAADDLAAHAPSLRELPRIATDKIDLEAATCWQESACTSDTVAFLQYTSGSTGSPKAVVLTHANLLHNAAIIHDALGHHVRDRYVSWLPTFHDMGFMAGVLEPLYARVSAVLMSPLSFLERPLRWLQAITRYGGTISGGPNFAYDLCVRKVRPEDLGSLDLSGWTVAFNGAEPIRAETLERFAAAFRDCGFRREAFYPCYGLAEATLMVTGGPKGSSPVIRRTGSGFSRGTAAGEAEPANEVSLPLASCGQPLPQQRIVIVNPQTLTECSDEQVGEIWISGPSVAQGYWNRPEETEHAFGARLQQRSEATFLRTGDLGFLSGGHLYVTSRLKDLIIIRGRNHYPQDIEITVEQSHVSLRPGCGAALSVEVGSEERLVIVQELEQSQGSKIDSVIESIREAVAAEHELEVFAVVLLKRGSIPKTTSGKTQRHLCRKAFLSNALDQVAEWRVPERPEGEAERPIDGCSTRSISAWLLSRLADRLSIDPLTVDLDQPLYRYGLDSLASIELCHQLETAFGIRIPVSSFLKGCAINEVIASATSVGEMSDAEPVLRSCGEIGQYPLSYGQRGLWFLCQLNPNSPAYAITKAVRIRAELDVPALRRAFQYLVSRHSILRTTFVAVDGQPTARVAEHAQVFFRPEDASSYDEAQLHTRLIEEARRPFDLTKDPLVRVHLFYCAPGDYVLCLSIHHIISDFWSLALLFDELGTAYYAGQRGIRPEFQPLDFEYGDYVFWQRQVLAGSRGGQLRAYWREKLSGDLPILDLPVDRPRPAVQTCRAASESLQLSSDEVAALRAVGSERCVTLYMILLAALQALLRRYTAQNEILIGTPLAGRNAAGLERVFGYFVNSVAIVAHLSEDPPFDEFLSQVRDTVLGAFDHQDYPFPLLVDELQIVRDSSRPGVFQVMFVLQKSHLPNAEGLAALALEHLPATVEVGGLTLESVSLEQQIAQFDLTLTMAEVRDAVAASLEYNSDLFDAPTITRMAGHLRTLIGSIVEDPKLRISRLRILTEAESRELTTEGRSVIAESSDFPCIHQLAESQAERIPDAVAVVFGQEHLTYMRLDQRASMLARRLQSLGARPEAFVAVCLERELELIPSLLAILKSGAAYLPLDPAYPAERMAHMLDESGAALLLTSTRLLGRLPEHRTRVICVDADQGAIATEHAIGANSIPLSGNPAYMIYTSGSTGAPKGVIVSHFNVIRLLESTQNWFKFNDIDRWTLFHSYAFDFSVWEMWGCLAYGGCLIVVPYWVSRAPELFYELLCLEGVTVLNQTPSAFRQLMLAEKEILTRDGFAVRLIVFGGEALDAQSLSPWFDRHGDLSPVLVNMYGITETTVHVTYRQISINDLNVFGQPAHMGSSPAGQSLPEWGVSLLDEHLERVPVGIVGEVHVTGSGLARGYADRPDLTADRFIPNPFGGLAGQRMYRSGDLARYSKSGELLYVGRLDQQIKLRGFRIELGEIESIVRRHPAVADAAVLLRSDGHSERQIVCYLVCDGGAALTASDVREFLSRKLPDYMLPSAFVMLEAFPLTSSGKLDRRALPAPDTSAAGSADFESATTSIEKTLAVIWADVLGVDRVGISDNFFELGGDSIISIQVVSRARQAGLLITPRQIFEQQTIGQLARVVTTNESPRTESALLGAGDSVPQASITGLDQLLQATQHVEAVYPLSPMQHGMLFHTLYAPDSGVYCTQLVCDLDGRLDSRAFERAWQRLVDHHAVLRTAFEWETVETPVQVVRKEVNLNIELLDWSDVRPERQREQFEELLRSDRRLGFHLDTPPLMRLTLIRVSDDKHRLLWSCHHLLMDGWSLPIVLEQIFALYDAYAEGKDTVLQDSIPFKDYIEWLQKQDARSAESFWKNQLRGFNKPNSFPVSPVESRSGGYSERHIILSAERTAALKAAARKHQLTLNTIAQGAWALVVARRSGSDDVVYGTVTSGRPAEINGVQSMIGLFINTLPVRVKVDYGQTPLSWLHDLQGKLVDIRQYEYSDLSAVQAWSDVPRGTRVFETIFVFENYPLDASLFQPRSGLRISNIRPIEQTNYPLTAAVVPGERLGIYIAYDLDRFDEATIEGLLGEFSNLMEAMIVDPVDYMSQLPNVMHPSWNALPERLNNTRAEYAAECVQQLFEAQTARGADRTALILEEHSVTYGELDARSNRFARYLYRVGLRQGHAVGVSLRRSIDLVVAMLGVLKSGAAYLPIDPQLPEQRRLFMLEDAQAALLVTDLQLAEPPPQPSLRRVSIGETEEESKSGIRASTDQADGHCGPEDLAYLIYTSGSTGRPKAVMVGHRSLSNHVQWMQDEFPLTENDRVLQKYSISFDTSVLEILYPLLSGSALVIATPEGHHDIEYLAGLLETQGITAIDVVPSMLRALLDCQNIEGSSLRRVICGGDTLGSELRQRFYERLPGRELANLYGPTETTISATYCRCEADMDGGRVPIGRPIANTQVHILDGRAAWVPFGMPGEIYVGGEGLAWGYLNNPQLTAEKFLPDHLSAESGARLYRTGDLGQYRADGSIEFIGRKDDQVKLRGFRIEPGEVEARLDRHPGIAASAVVALDGTDREKRLAAYVVARTPNVLGASELRGFLGKELPEYMIPAAFVMLGELPLTPSGKIDKRALPPPGEGRMEPESEYVAARTAVEQRLAEIWADVLGVERVGVHDNFFDLGGDSIISIQITARARQLGIEITPKALFENPTVGGVAGTAKLSRSLPAQQTAVTGKVELTPIQRWFFELETLNPHHYNQAVMLEVSPDLGYLALQTAITALVAHHDALRLRFIKRETGWEQENQESEDNQVFKWIDLSGLQNRGVLVEKSSEVQRSLSLEKGPVIRAVYFDFGPDNAARLLIVIHHLSVDVVSWRILLEDLKTACEQLRRGEVIRLGPKSTSFKEWAGLLSDHASAGAWKGQLDYWVEELSAEIDALPVDQSGASNTVGSVAGVHVELSPEETRALLQEVLMASRSQINEVLLTALAQSFSAWTAVPRLLIDLEGHGREHIIDGVDLSRTVGWFTTIFPVLIDLGPAATEGAALRGVKKKLRGVPDRGIGYGLLRYLASDQAVCERLARMQVPQICFNYLGQLDRTLAGSYFAQALESPGPPRSESGKRSHLIEIDASVVGGKLQLEWSYSNQIHRPETIEHLADEFIHRLRLLIRNALAGTLDSCITSDFPLARLDQRQLEEWATLSWQIEDVYPATPTHEGLIFHSRLSPASGAYCTQMVATLKGELNVNAFRNAWQCIVDRQSALRTAFVALESGELLQVVHRRTQLPLAFIDLQSVDQAAQQQQLDDYLKVDRIKGFDPQQPPLMRLVLMRCASNRHWLVWTSHHALLDGWCVSMILREGLSLYQAFGRGEKQLGDQARPYRDYVAWLMRQDLSGAELFWRRMLRGFRQPIRLTSDHRSNGSVQQEGSYEDHQVRLSLAATADLNSTARRCQLTVSTFVHAAWALLLSRYTGQEDIVFGTVLSGRPPELAGVESMVGLFINTLPLRVQVPAERKLLPWLKDVQNLQTELRQHEYSPLVRVQNWGDVRNGQSLFETILAFENYPVASGLAGPNWSLEISYVRTIDRTNYPITVAAAPEPELSIQVTYDCSMFDRSMIARILGHVAVLLETMAAGPEYRLAELPLLTPSEKNQLVVEWNDTGTCYNEHKSIQLLFEEQASGKSDAIAVVAGEEQITYGELNRRADHLAWDLLSRHLQPEGTVGLFLDRSVEMVTAMLGTLKAGGAFVPLDPEYPGERTRFVLDDSQAHLLVTRERLVAKLPIHSSETVLIEGLSENIDIDCEQKPVTVTGSSPAYLMYTSGSTGQPKGAIGLHGGTVNRFRWMWTKYPFQEGEICCQKTSMSFGDSVWEVFGQLAAGIPIVVIPPDDVKDPMRLIRVLQEQSISRIVLVPSLLRAILDCCDDAIARKLAGVKYWVCSGEELPGELQERFVAAMPGSVLLNLYGSSEISADVTFCEAGAALPGSNIAIGRPINNTQAYILDGGMEPVPIGVAGELYIGGDGLGRGYLNRPDLTASSFLANPFDRLGGSRLYRTGDLARYRHSGEIEFLGRTDHQVKIRGFRIELGEIESLLRRHPAVEQAAVSAEDDGRRSRRLVAYFVARHDVSPSRLKEYLQEKLPEYMIPAVFLQLDQLPLTASGKIDRRALPTPEMNVAEKAYVAPRTAVEEIVCAICRDVLRVERVGVQDDFFELGGHSLLATQVVSRVNHLLGASLSLRSFFESSTIAEISRAIVANENKPGRTENIASLIVRVSNMPPDEVERMLLEKDLQQEHVVAERGSDISRNG